MRVGVVVFDGVKLLDVAGPTEVFAEANRVGNTDYTLVTLAVGAQAVTSSTGMAIKIDADLRDTEVDTLLVAGGDRLVGRPIEPELVDAVRDAVQGTPRVCSICTGAFVLAAAGVLDGRRATTHWQHARLLAKSYPHVTVEPDSIWVQDGPVFTSAGVSAGIDLALALVEKDAGGEVARTVAQSLVVFLQRPGGQSQFSPSTSRPRPRSSVLRDVMDAVVADPGKDHSATRMAASASVSTRHLTRLFHAELGVTPARYVEEVRIDAGKRALEQGMTVADAAREAGFGTSESMRRAFVLRVGVSPRAYQQRFRSTLR
ncbi:GlxA family transcriptional regulator [Kibdelosporangium aridum]|uniref:Transcriptional regulator GlxA family, contains an amidase domain and an AraC-type DNA-binding HTH domain n=1 Tax=Kibdelosporangium aridum TaxID=2030 RepID=A0A1W1ZXW5_KIBAR|nr:GlxA family transcriptional regulator [Kibdelosporangium aridum]SMC53223.1 Transcriptional regulator GlxA family, contains an amidase domain and an AraC-type DNA-binding HTH domain [Kibdelosporangium aridum]